MDNLPIHRPLVVVREFYERNTEALRMQLVAGDGGLNRQIREPTVNRPGLALAGFRRYFAPKRVQVIGNVETAYLTSLDPVARGNRYRELFQYRIPCVVVCRGLRTDRDFIAAANRSNVPVFKSELITMKFINQATLALENLFAPRGQVHGCMVDVQGVGVVVQGESGIGKSEAVLGLLERGYSLVADDVVVLHLEDGTSLVGTAKEEGRNMMEIRGIGIVNVAATFGVAAIRREKRVDLVVEMVTWDSGREVDRLGLEQQYVDWLGVRVPRMTIPVRPGRDLARLIEVAAFQTKLKLSGYNAAEEFTRRLAEKMRSGLQL